MTVTEPITESRGFWIDGTWAAPSGAQRIEINNASTGAAVATVPVMTRDDRGRSSPCPRRRDGRGPGS